MPVPGFTLDGQRGLGDRGRQHHLAAALPVALQRRALLCKRQRTIQWIKRDIRMPPGQQRSHPVDLARPGQEHQRVAGCVVQRL
jgi:hypothetical protein